VIRRWESSIWLRNRSTCIQGSGSRQSLNFSMPRHRGTPDSLPVGGPCAPLQHLRYSSQPSRLPSCACRRDNLVHPVSTHAAAEDRRPTTTSLSRADIQTNAPSSTQTSSGIEGSAGVTPCLKLQLLDDSQPPEGACPALLSLGRDSGRPSHPHLGPVKLLFYDPRPQSSITIKLCPPADPGNIPAGRVHVLTDPLRHLPYAENRSCENGQSRESPGGSARPKAQPPAKIPSGGMRGTRCR
jgi:hypothetical protein